MHTIQLNDPNACQSITKPELQNAYIHTNTVND